MGTKWRAPKKHNIKAWKKVASGKILWESNSYSYLPPTKERALAALLKQKDHLVRIINNLENRIMQNINANYCQKWLPRYRKRLEALKVEIEKLS